MKRFALLLAMLCAGVSAGMAQKITVKDFGVLQRDISARTSPRTAPDGKGCALIKVDVVGVKDMTFAEAVGEVKYSLSQYNVYVPEDTKTLTYTYGDGQYSGVVSLEDYGLDIIEKTTYRLQFEKQDRMRSAVFSVNPQSATVVLNSQELPLDESGIAEQDLPVGSYDYLVTAPGYNPQSGTVTLTDNEVSTLTSVNLEQVTHNVQITSNNPQGYLFVDNVPYGVLGDSRTLTLPQGEHQMRLSSEQYKDYEESFTVNGDKTIYAETKKMREKEVRYKEERSRRRVNLRPAYYVRGGYSTYDKDDYLLYGESGGLQFDVINHFFGFFALDYGCGIGAVWRRHEDTKTLWQYESSVEDISNETDGALYFEVPLQAGVSFPFGNYNLHMFSAFAGGYYRFIWNPGQDFDEEDSEYEDMTSRNDYGLRASVRLDIGTFSLGAHVSKSLAKDFGGVYMGVTVGFKFYLAM